LLYWKVLFLPGLARDMLFYVLLLKASDALTLRNSAVLPAEQGAQASITVQSLLLTFCLTPRWIIQPVQCQCFLYLLSCLLYCF